MAKKDDAGYQVRMIGVYFENGERREKPLEEYTKEELHETATRMNLEALAAAGFVPVEGQAQAM